MRVQTRVEIDLDSGRPPATTTTVLTSNPATGTNADLLRGIVYQAGNVGVGQKLNALDWISLSTELSVVKTEKFAASASNIGLDPRTFSLS